VIETGDGRPRGAPSSTDAPRATGRRRLPGINLRQGAAKQARLESGLSLAQLGKGHVTAPAIYLIETGRTRPSLPTLEHIAKRTGKPIEFFLADPGGVTDETQAGLVELENLVAAAQFAQAAELGQKLLALGTSAHRLGRIRFFLAQAQLNLGHPEEAAVLLKAAHSHFEAVDDQLMLAECLGSEASLAYLTQRREAQALIEQALAICRGFDPVPHPTEARLLSILAAVHLTNKEWDKAIKAYQLAIDAAGTVYDLRRLALMYGGMSNAYRETGQVEAAARFANRSIALFEVLRDQLNLARVENNLGLVMLSMGDHAQAREHLDRSLDLFEETELEIGRSNVLLSLCELSLTEGHVEHAKELAEKGLELAERLDERPNVAEAHIWLGQVADRAGDNARADREFQLAIGELTNLGLEERLLRCHGVYAEILERRGDMEQAYVHMKKAFSASRPGLLHREDEDSEETASLA
jgi:tetratricopeptide (TPR) repeat protein/DNA-binding XRE family transcriptional regulator